MAKQPSIIISFEADELLFLIGTGVPHIINTVSIGIQKLVEELEKLDIGRRRLMITWHRTSDIRILIKMSK